MKRLIAIAALAVSTLTVVSAKTYEVILNRPAKAGSVELKAGRYKLAVDGDKATFTEQSNSRKSYTTPVKVQENDKKYENTRIITSKQGEAEQIDEINLGGSKTRLGF